LKIADFIADLTRIASAANLQSEIFNLQLNSMPIYEYHCAGCGTDFELLVRGGTVVKCPSCEARKVERRLSVPAPPSGAPATDFSNLGPPSGGCHGGGCGCH